MRATGSLLSLSPCIVISLFLSVVDHVDNTEGRRRGERTKAEDDGEASDGNEQEPGKMCRVLRCDVATMHGRQHSQPWEAGAGGPVGAGLALAAGGRRDRRNTTDVECQSNGQGWHNHFLTKLTPSSILFSI